MLGKAAIMLMFLSLCLSFTACIKTEDPFKEDEEENPGGKEEEEEEEKKSGKLVSFTFEKKYNSNLVADVKMTIHANGNISGHLRNDVDLKSLKPSFVTQNGGMYLNNEKQESGKNSCDFSQSVAYVFKDDRGKKTNYTINLLAFTGLPVVTITAEAEADKINKDDWVVGTVKIDGMGKFDDYEGPLSVRGRGNTTWKYYPKKPFNIKLDTKDPILGMPKHKRWSLLANYRDRTSLRNNVTFHIGQMAKGLEWTPRSQFAELVFNGEHFGLYQVTEHIRLDKNRVNATEMTSEDVDDTSITGGYLLELDTRFDEVNHFSSLSFGFPYNFKNPDEEVLVPAQKAYLTNYINTFEKDLKANKFEDVYDYIDVNSFIDYFIVQSLVGNTEVTNPLSVFFYKKRSGKLYAGPLWDFDYTTFATTSDRFEGTGGKKTVHFKSLYYEELFKDPDFVQKVKDRFKELKPELQKIPDYILEQSELLIASDAIDYKKWPIDSKTSSPLGGHVNGDEELSYDDAIARMIEMYNGRLKLLETEINKR